MNEWLFCIHIFLIIGFALGALRLGKEALVVWVVIQAILANLFVIKQMHFLSFEVTCSDVFIIGSIFGLNLIQEYFGKESAKRASLTCFYFLFFFALMSQIHLLYRPSCHDTSHSSFLTLFSSTPRLLAASLATFFLVQQLDIRLFTLLKKTSLPFPLRSSISLIVSQFIDTVLFSFLGLWGLVASLGDIIFISFLLKLIISLSMAPFTSLSKRMIRP